MNCICRNIILTQGQLSKVDQFSHHFTDDAEGWRELTTRGRIFARLAHFTRRLPPPSSVMGVLEMRDTRLFYALVPRRLQFELRTRAPSQETWHAAPRPL